MHVGLLHHCRQRLLGQPARFQEAREVAAFAQLGDAQLHRAGARLPRPVAVAVALRDPLRTALAMGRAGQPLDLQLHQALGGEADHLAQQVGVGTLFQKGTKVHHLIGHRWILGSVAWFSDQTLPMIRDGHRKPLARYRATGARSLAACSAELHHQLGRDRRRRQRGIWDSGRTRRRRCASGFKS